MRAAGLHPVVKALASGAHYASGGGLPMVPEYPARSAVLDDGSLVYVTFARKPWGRPSSERTVSATGSKLLPLPGNIDDAQAASIANPGMSAWLSL